MKISSRAKLVAVTFLAFLVVAAVAGGWFWILLAVRKSRLELVKIEEKIASLELERNSAKQWAGLLEERSGALARLDRFGISREQPVEFIEELEGLAKQTGNRLALDFDEQRSKGPILFFRLSVDGTSKSTRQYLKLLELLPHELWVEEFVMQEVGEVASGSGRAPKSPLPSKTRLIIVIGVKPA